MDKCLIMDDDELERASKKVEWRKGNSFQTRNLFVPSKPPTEFPRAFQTYGKGSAQPFSFRGKTAPKKQFTPLVDLSGTPVLTAESIAEFGVPLLPMPELRLPATWDDDPPYAPCTPPLGPVAPTSATAESLEGKQ